MPSHYSRFHYVSTLNKKLLLLFFYLRSSSSGVFAAPSMSHVVCRTWGQRDTAIRPQVHVTLPQQWPAAAGTSSTAGSNKLRLSSPFNLDFTPNKTKVLFCRSRRVAPGPRGSTTIPSGRETGISALLSGLSHTPGLHLLGTLNKLKRLEVDLFTLDCVLLRRLCAPAARHTAPQAQVGQSQETRIALVLHPLTDS